MRIASLALLLTLLATPLSAQHETGFDWAAPQEEGTRHFPDQGRLDFRRELVRVMGDSLIRLGEIAPITPGYDAPLDTERFRVIERVAGELLPGVPVATPVSAGAGDRPTSTQAGMVSYRLHPCLVAIEENRCEVHDDDQRLSMDNVGRGIRFYTRLLQEAGR